MLTSSSVDAPATVLWTRTTAMSITAAVTLAQMKPMMRSAALSAIDPVPCPTRIYTGHLLPEFCETYFLSEIMVKPVAGQQLGEQSINMDGLATEIATQPHGRAFG